MQSAIRRFRINLTRSAPRGGGLPALRGGRRPFLEGSARERERERESERGYKQRGERERERERAREREKEERVRTSISVGEFGDHTWEYMPQLQNS